VAHVRRGDPIWQGLAEVACALHWFNPLVWLAARQLRVERELAADDRVLVDGTRASDYAAMLVGLACEPATLPDTGAVVPLLTPAGLKARLTGVLDGTRARLGGRLGRAAILGLGMALFLPVARAVPIARLPGPRPPVAATGPIIARVLDEDGQAVAGAQAALHGLLFPALPLQADAQGWIRWPERAPAVDDFVLYARHEGRAARMRVLAMPYGTTLPVELRLRGARAVSGHVRDEAGRAVAGATVRVVRFDRAAVGPGPDMIATTDSAGAYRFDGLLYGRYDLLFEAPSGVAAGRPVVVADSDVDPIDVTVAAAWPVSGWVKDDAGRPVAGARVDATDTGMEPGVPVTDRRHWSWDETAADGSFRMVPFRRGLRVVARDAGGRLLLGRIENGKGEIRVPPTIVVAPDLFIAGAIHSPDGKPIRGARVSALEDRGPAKLWRMAIPVDDEGRFLLGPLPAGRYDLNASSGGQFVRVLLRSVELRDRPVEDVELVAPRL
jgi:hypothetical protein